MIQDVILPSTHEQQIQPYTCGAACINMVLSHWAKAQAQLAVWAKVQVAHPNVVRPSNATWPTGSFASQRCDQCSQNTTTDLDGKVFGDYHCWFTSPAALATTLNLWSPVAVAEAEASTGAAAIVRIVESLAATPPVPAVCTVQPALHWVVAVGYQLDGPNTGVPWNGRQITGLYVRDPADTGQGTWTMKTVAGLLIMAIECGADAGRYPLVVNGPASGGRRYWWLSIVSIFAGIILWIDPRRFWKPRTRPPGPTPPASASR